MIEWVISHGVNALGVDRTFTSGDALQRRRQSLESLIARYEREVGEKDKLLSLIRKEQERLTIFKRSGYVDSDPLCWVDSWRPRQPHQKIMGRLLSLL
jgi:hypothetical protein